MDHSITTYGLTPGIIARHKVRPPPLPLQVCVGKGTVVKFIFEVRVVEHLSEDMVYIAVPHFIFCSHPGWGIFFTIYVG